MKYKDKFYLIIVFFTLPFTTYAVLPVIDSAAIIQLSYQLTQLKQQTQFIQQELMQLSKNQYQWSNAQALINNLGDVVNQTNSLAYSAVNINQKFQHAYPGYQAPQDFSQQYQQNTSMTLNTLNGVLQSIGTSAQDFATENTRLQFLQQQAQSSTGQLQAIQAATQIASEMVTQQQLLRQTMLAQTNAQTTYYATQLQSDASLKAELQQIINSGSTTIPPYGTSGHQLNTPNF